MQTRNFIRLAAGFAAAFAACAALAQAEIAKPLRLVVPYPPGGSSDVQARLVGAGLAERIGQSVIVDNRPGAAGIIGAEYVARQPADGHTLLLAAPPFVITPYTVAKLPYDVRRDFAPLSLVARAPMLVAVGRDFPAGTFASLVALAKERPGKVTHAYINGGVGHLSGALLARRLKIELLNVPYKGSAPALADLVGGHVAMLLTTQLDLAAQLGAGTVRVLAIGAPQRSRFLPDVPTLAEAGFPGVELGYWFSGLGMRAGTRADLLERLSSDIAAVLKQADVRQKLDVQSVDVIGSTTAQYAAFLEAELGRWAEAVAIAGIKPQ
ncbi:MAG: tripartite tricarboxylate transporter substrate binding protein [Burkholderiales bacterium]|nr:tripartite tricarboxylate transporter substrate binding protein [Burkholderiales bacterium]